MATGWHETRDHWHPGHWWAQVALAKLGLMKSSRESTALVLVDPYNDFLAEDGKIYPRLKEVAEAVGLHRHLRELLAAVRAAGIQVVIAPHRRYRPGDFEGWLRPGRPAKTVRDGKMYETGTKGGEWYPDIAPLDGDIVASEHWGASGFADTDLDLQLRQRGLDRIILAGLTAPGCVEGTGRFALELGYTVILVKDATAAFTKEWMHAAVELNAPIYAESVLSTDEVTASIRRNQLRG
jgi:nicotinamidase-related amidase